MALDTPTSPNTILSRLEHDLADLLPFAAADQEINATVQNGRAMLSRLRASRPNLFTPPSECCGDPERCFECYGDLRPPGIELRD